MDDMTDTTLQYSENNFNFEGNLYNVYQYTMPGDRDAFLNAYRQSAEAMKYTVTEDNELGTPAMRLTDLNGNTALLLYDYGGVMMLMVPLNMDYGKAKPTATPSPSPTPKVTATPTPAVVKKTITKQVITIDSGSFIRSGPGGSYEQVGATGQRSQTTELLGQMTSNGETWYKIVWDDCAEAYVHSSRAGSPETKSETVYTYKGKQYITFGHYEQDNNTNNGKEPIEWIILDYDAKNNRALVISRYGLDAHRFDASTYQGWDKSEIRGWLNSTFLNTAFTAAEQKAIATTTVKTGNNDEWVAHDKKMGWSYDTVNGGADTQDKVFLLSVEEAMAYGGYSTLEDFFKKKTDKMKVLPTKYALVQGADTYGDYKLNGVGCC